MKSLRKGVKPNKAPISQIRMRVRGSFGPPGTEWFSNVPRRAATQAMHNEMFFSWSTDQNCARSLGSWRKCTSDHKNPSKMELETPPNGSTPLLWLELRQLLKKAYARKCPFIHGKYSDMLGDRDWLPSNQAGWHRARCLHQTTKANGKARRLHRWACLWFAQR